MAAVAGSRLGPGLALVRVAALLGVAGLTLVRVAALLRIARALAWFAGRRVPPLVGRILPPRVLAGGWFLRAPVTVVVILVGPPLSLASAVIRIVGHRLYSWFCGVRAVSLCWGGFASGGVWVDRTTCAKLSGVQVRRLLESNDHITIRLPPLLMDVTLQVPGKGGRSQVRVGAHLLVVGHAEGNEVLVGRQKSAARQLPHTGLGFPVQHGLDLLRHNRSAEHAREGVAHRRLELALDAVRETHLIACLHRRRLSLPIRCPVTACRVTTPVTLHGIGTPPGCGTNRTLRIVSVLVAGGRVRIGTVGVPGRKFDRLPRLLGRVAEWQTRWLQVPVSFGTWGFKSPFAHNRAIPRDRDAKATNQEWFVAFVLE